MRVYRRRDRLRTFESNRPYPRIRASPPETFRWSTCLRRDLPCSSRQCSLSVCDAPQTISERLCEQCRAHRPRSGQDPFSIAYLLYDRFELRPEMRRTKQASTQERILPTYITPLRIIRPRYEKSRRLMEIECEQSRGRLYYMIH